MVRPTLVDLNPVDLKYYPFMTSLDKCIGISNVLFPKICRKRRKTMTKHI